MNADLYQDVADRLFGAIERGEYDTVADMWADDVTVWHTGDSQDNDRIRALKVIRWFMNATSTRSYEILDRRFFDGGFVQQHVLRASQSDATSIEMRVCIVIKVDVEGRITRVDEYFDPADMTPLLRSTT
ncbi:nuclear transport factor 2 family protein [Mycolicibacterium sp. P9-64]|uniref:nuclear transport factor 2 family protein n=1 Tax=Mycolicibacterium sp. P9-64 TaxID=2024612 RepID=UPI001F5B16D9|nr:nuclear transport factor 2 family protein [Mycolicibacterium sp. P9-64]